MSLEQSLGLRQEQRLALLPQMLQSIEVLQMATADLLQFLQLEAERNETLELRAEGVEQALPNPPEPRSSDLDHDGDSTTYAGGDDGEDRKRAFLESVADARGSLVDHVREQLAYREVGSELADAVVRLAENLDDRGLLPFALADLAAEFGLPPELLADARRELQALEPRGLGAADPVEAMLLQAVGDPDLAIIERLLREHLDDLGRNRLPDVARAVGLSLEELQDVLARMRELNPRPGSEFTDEASPAIRPDAYASLHEGRVLVSLEAAAIPELVIDSGYAALAKDRSASPELRDYLRPKLRVARDLIAALQQRQDTLLRVVQAVMEEQRPFLQRGRSAIAPLRMSGIAERLDMHTSTVSRAIAGKHVATEHGLFRLRDFFDGGRLADQHVAGQGRMGVAQQIADLIAGEDKGAPLSDDDLVHELARRGVHAARRTIAKYRKELDIPSSYRRKQHRTSQ